jgi:hypothetical protein
MDGGRVIGTDESFYFPRATSTDAAAGMAGAEGESGAAGQTFAGLENSRRTDLTAVITGSTLGDPRLAVL